ncbi:hypothetical protein [uncultured Fibrobacter sp.]|uniref:hypothetical protein n=1 Tax=uncultured Fibrobacter sp. TaxID=261512 RepID=UPI00261B859A|nr:hypothetical protein [uncultured Fibrobacter sp.]
MINSASANKQEFDTSINGVRESLDEMVGSQISPTVAPNPAKTGWLKGSLSYPWVFVCSLVPSFKDLF